MKTFITTEKDIRSCKDRLPTDAQLIFFKMISIGPNTMRQSDYQGDEIYKVANAQPGFFIFGNDINEMREAMHDLVDRFFEAKKEN
jgi:hypothetical protein